MEMSLVSAASNAAPQTVNGAASLNVLKKTMDMQQQTVSTLLESVGTPQYSNPPNLGSSIDVKA